MKQKDYALILVFVFIAAVLAFIISNLVFGGTDHKTEVDSAQPISSEFVLPDEKFFNQSSLNPTKTIIIGDDGNPDPFNNTTNQTQPEVPAN